ncbi:hypothetical protein [Saccharospirillum impatiens]|uniref:hypothetical protein n=1 Tax=Saccharospirillum impatiens TaxID=169438 RepID=UPI0003FC0481|nr:hypothetical protein [Saccharospirillum impatiens]
MDPLHICRTGLLSAAVLSAAPWAAALEPVTADWLYLTGNGSWVARSATLRQVETPLALPVDQLSSGTFWWSATDPDLQVSWQSTDSVSWVSEGSLVQVTNWPGSWTVVSSGPELLVLAQAGVRRSLPQSAWDRLSWVVGQNQEESLSLRVRQPEDHLNELDYAWFDGRVSAEVRYSLDYQAENPVLLQQLVVHNDTDYDLDAPGYSYAQSSQQPVMMMARDAMAASSERTEVGRPQAGDSSGQATLSSAQPIRMPANSHAWIPVDQVALDRIDHQYRFNWSTRQQGSQSGQWQMTVTSDDALPTIAGPLQIAIWDQQVALLETQYQPEQETQTTLSLGSSDMVTLGTESLSGQQWELVVTNRNSHDVEAVLDLSHWEQDRSDQAGISLPVPANESVRLQVRLSSNQLTVRPL